MDAISDYHRVPRQRTAAMLGLAALVLAACAGSARHPEAAAAAAPIASGVPISREDVLWLERIGFGLNSGELADYRRLGRQRFLDEQLSAPADELPAPIASQIASLGVSHLDPTTALAAVRASRRQIQGVADGSNKQQARRLLFQQGAALAAEATRRELLRALYDPAQLREQMVWFWLNHFSVQQNKADLPWLVGDYEERAIRPHALGHFRDLVMATLEHPAMLEYLDNYQNAAGHLNENYAREFMELHTLGVDGGYTQQDVQQLARVFTGVGVYAGRTPRLRPAQQGLYVQHGAFEFNPARHDFASKVLLGHRLDGVGFAEVQNAVTLIVRQRACAHFISQQLATYFVADHPPAALVEAMTQTFQRTDGDIAAVLRTMFISPELDAALGSKFKDPMRYVISAMRLAYDGQPISNTRPLLNWLGALGEAPFGRQTPDGYPLTDPSWASPGQLSRRFEIARVIGSGAAPLFVPDGAPADPNGAGRGGAAREFSSTLFIQTVGPFLAGGTRAALGEASSPQEWNTFLLSSPELNYE